MFDCMRLEHACTAAEMFAHMAPMWPSACLPPRNPIAAALLGQLSSSHTNSSGSGEGSSGASSQRQAAAPEAFPVDFFESCSPIMLDVQLAGDFTHAGGASPLCACLLPVHCGIPSC